MSRNDLQVDLSAGHTLGDEIGLGIVAQGVDGFLDGTLIDVLPEDCVAAIGEVLRAAVEVGLVGDQAHRLAKQLRAESDPTRLVPEPVRMFASAGTLSAELTLAERATRTASICWNGCPVHC